MTLWQLGTYAPSTPAPAPRGAAGILATQATLTTATVPSRSDDRIRPRPWQPARDPSAMATGDGQPPPSARSCIHKPRRRPMCDSQGPLLRRNRRPEQRPGAGGRSATLQKPARARLPRGRSKRWRGLLNRCFRENRQRCTGARPTRWAADPLPGTLCFATSGGLSCESMAKTGDTLTLSPKERLTITSSAADSGGEPLAMQAQYAPGGSPPPEHYHPTQEETFTGVSGTVTA